MLVVISINKIDIHFTQYLISREIQV